MEVSLFMKCVFEFLGTLALVLLGDGVCAACTLNKSKAQGAGWIVITLGWGFAVMAGVFIAGPYSGAMMLFENAGAYVLVALLAFMAGVVLSVLLIRRRKRDAYADQENGENNNTRESKEENQ